MKTECAYLVQKFARLELGNLHILGYSVAGEETVVQVPELDVCFDIGRAPHFTLASNYVCISHAHMDHVAGLGYYVSQRVLTGTQPGTIFVHEHVAGALDRVLRAWQEIEGHAVPYRLIPLTPGQTYPLRRDLVVRAIASRHGNASLAYAMINVRQKLKPEYQGRSQAELAALRAGGVEVHNRVEIPLVAFTGDTAAGPVFEHPDIKNAEILITECTFFDAAQKQRAKAGRHLHLDDLVTLVAKLNNQHIIIGHVTRRIGISKARYLLSKRISPERLAGIRFLMDFAEAKELGDVTRLAAPMDAGQD